MLIFSTGSDILACFTTTDETTAIANNNEGKVKKFR